MTAEPHPTIALAGNPNCGKTALFNALTGLAQHVGNFPGVTVERKEGHLRDGQAALVVDLPGMYALTPVSPEERVAVDFLTSKPVTILNAVDGTCLSRGLYLTLQLLALGRPMVVAITMMDEVEKSGIRLDIPGLARILQVPVFPVMAAKGEGVAPLAQALLLAKPPKGQPPPGQAGEGEAAILGRYAAIDTMLAQVTKGDGSSKAQDRTQRLDRVLTHRVLCFPLFGGIMALLFYLTFGPLGGGLQNLFQQGMAGLITLIDRGLSALAVTPWLRALVVEGILSGIGSVLSFLPTILILFFLLSLLEDSGYMARMAFLTDGFFARLGLSGRAFVPALLGLGCSVPAILSTRTLPTRRERRQAILLIPFLSCSAKLPIYALFAGAFFPGREMAVFFVLYGGGALLGLLVTYGLRRLAFSGDAPPFLLELPAYRLPTLKSALLLMRTRTGAFLRSAMTTLLLCSVAIWALSRVDISLRPALHSGDSLLAAMGKTLSPLLMPLGFGDWRAVTALLTGLLAKEGVVASLGVLFHAPTEYALGRALTGLFTPLQVASFLTFTLLYMPCMAAFAAMRRELGGLRYALMAALFQMGIAWLAALLVYQAGRLILG